MRRTAVWLAVAAVLSTAAPVPARAASYVAQDIWYSTMYGGAIGGVAGTGVMLLTDDPLDHTDYIYTGIGVGILAGLAYGIYSYSASDDYAALANVDAAGATRYAVPMPRPFVTRDQAGEEHLGVRVDLIRGRF